jgi:hypothetical protein
MKYLTILFALLFSFSAAAAETYKPLLPVDNMTINMSSIEKNIRNSAVRVTLPFNGGHGSGSYIKYKDVHLVITAQHVTDAALGTSYLVSHKYESHAATLIYADEKEDIAVLFVGNHFKTIKPMEFDPMKETAEVGTELLYSGYPSHHSLMSFRGRVAGHEKGPTIGKHIIMHSYGWFGCSGSVVYNLKGKIVGVLYGVDVEYRPNQQVQENMIWVVPINKMNIDVALNQLCRGWRGKKPLKACK